MAATNKWLNNCYSLSSLQIQYRQRLDKKHVAIRNYTIYIIYKIKYSNFINKTKILFKNIYFSKLWEIFI